MAAALPRVRTWGSQASERVLRSYSPPECLPVPIRQQRDARELPFPCARRIGFITETVEGEPHRPSAQAAPSDHQGPADGGKSQTPTPVDPGYESRYGPVGC